MDFDYELLGEIAENAPTAGGDTSFVNYGRVYADNFQVSRWNSDKQAFEKREYKGGAIDSEKKETLEFQLHLDQSEVNPAIEWVKTWYIQVKQSGKRAKDKTMWGEIILPSIVSQFDNLGSFFKAVTGSKKVYVAIEDHLTGKIRVQASTGKEFDVTAPKFLAVFKNLAECKTMKLEKYNKSKASANGSIPVETVNQVKALLDQFGNDKTLEMLEGKPFGDYEPAELIEAAK